MTETAVAETAVAEDKPKREKKVVEATACACQFYSGQDVRGETLSTGCAEVTPRTFRPGHDAKLKSLLIKVGSAGNQVVKTVDGETEEMDPLHAAEEFGFRGLVEKSVDAAKAKEREAKKAETERKKAEAKAERDAKAAQKKAHAEAVAKAAEDRKSQPGPAKAKVGRSTVDGEILDDGTFKYKKGDDEVETTDYTPVIDPSTVEVSA